MDETVLFDQALAAANELLKRYEGLFVSENVDGLRAMLAMAWIEGRQAGGMEAQAALDRIIGKLR